MTEMEKTENLTEDVSETSVPEEELQEQKITQESEEESLTEENIEAEEEDEDEEEDEEDEEEDKDKEEENVEEDEEEGKAEEGDEEKEKKEEGGEEIEEGSAEETAVSESDPSGNMKISSGLFRSFLRAEKLYSEITEEDDRRILEPVQPYEMTIADLAVAYRNMINSGKPMVVLMEDWVIPFLLLADTAQLPELAGHGGIHFDEIPFEITEVDVGSAQEEIVFKILSDLVECCDRYDNAELEEEEFQALLTSSLELMDNCIYNKGRPEQEWRRTDEQKLTFIQEMEGSDELREDPELQETFRNYVDYLCEKDIPQALLIKGYGCYGYEDPVYECDWETARNCMLRLVEVGDDETSARAANTLGYIYYYGRCSSGEPDYEKAYQYFSYAAFNGLYESLYKIADMLHEGKGVLRRNDASASGIYWWAYEHTRDAFLNGSFDCEFADAALRMAGMYQRYGHYVWNLEESYGYYLQAEYANRLRMRESEFFGYRDVADHIAEGKQQVHDALEEMDFFTKKNRITEQGLEDFLSDADQIRVKVSAKGDDRMIRFRRIVYADPEDAITSSVLLTVPELCYCELTDCLELTTKKKSLHLGSTDHKFTADNWEIDKDGNLVLYKKTRKLLSVKVSRLSMKQSRDKKKKKD